MAQRVKLSTIAEALGLAQHFAEGEKICVVLGDNIIEKNIVDEIAVDEEVVPRATLRAAALAGKDRPTLAALKRALYADAIAKLEAAASRAG